MDPTATQAEEGQFSVYNQKVDLDVDFVSQSLTGKTEIVLLPISQTSKIISLNARQSRITSIAVDGFPARFTHNEPFRHCKPFSSYTVHQYHLHQERISQLLQAPSLPDLFITLPTQVKVQEIAAGSSLNDPSTHSARPNGDLSAVAETPMTAVGPVAEYGKSFNPIRVTIEYEIPDFRDGLHFVGIRYPDARYPHVYTKVSPYTTTASCIFPCIDDTKSRCQWEIAITCPRTLGDAFKPSQHGAHGQTDELTAHVHDDAGLTDDEKAIEMAVVCSGEMVDETISAGDGSRKTTSFSVSSALSPNQIGFAIGPFETVDLSDLREIDEDEKLGSNAAKVQAFCLPGRAAEVRNSCMPLAKAIDFFTTTFTIYPFNNTYKMCFVEDTMSDTIVTAGLTLCSTRLLYPENILDPINDVTRKLVHALAAQWAGIFIVPRNPKDSWVIVGSACYMTDLFLKTLFGNNDYRLRQKLASYRVSELDIGRPSLSGMGPALRLDPSELEFMALKSGLVLFILDRRLTRQSGSTGVTRIINRMFQNSKGGEVENTLISEEQFERLCEKMGHVKLEDFFNQWVQRAGCPRFEVRQSFNKKKLVVILTIEQTHATAPEVGRELDPNHFMREIKEDAQEIWAGEPVIPFKGPMTIRIHEADGTPYEHIIEIKEQKTQIEIPYNTKYKRLKRGRGRKDRKDVQAGLEGADGQEESLLYCLGDVLQDPDDLNEWGLREWPADLEAKMSDESYEWIRMDADFEWIGTMSINMPAYMFTSQLQQDRDVVAQLESVHWLTQQPAHPLAATFLLRTLMDKRYFHGIRTKAAHGLARHNNNLDFGTGMVGMSQLLKAHSELHHGSSSNDFSDRCAYIVQCSIAEALSMVRNKDGSSPDDVKRFFVERLKYNDNSLNDYSDCYYLATLMNGLAESLIVKDTQHLEANGGPVDLDIDYAARSEAINEIERYRRIDEWISSYQNIFSRTALDCLRKLALADVVQPKLADILQYTRRANSDLLRAKAFDCLSDLKALRYDAMIKYILHSYATEPSPFVRRHIWKAFAKGLAHLAMGEENTSTTETIDEGGLVVEQDISAEVRQAEYLRRHTLDGAFAALKKEVGTKAVLQSALWSAVSSPLLSPAEIEDILDVCNILYDPEDSIVARLKYPRYWGCENLGKGRVRLYQKEKVRTQMLRKPAPKPPAPRPSMSIKLSAPRPPPPIRKESVSKVPSTPGPVSTPISLIPPPPKQEPTPGPFIPSTPVASTPAPAAKSRLVKLRVPRERLKGIIDDVPLRRSAQPSNGIGAGPTIKLSPSPRPQSSACASSTTLPSQYGPTFTTATPTTTDEPQYGPVKSTPRPFAAVQGNTNGLHTPASATGAPSPSPASNGTAWDGQFAVPPTPTEHLTTFPSKPSKKRKSSASQHSDLLGSEPAPKAKKRKSESAESTPAPTPPIKLIKLKLGPRPKPEPSG